jgi:hypothetical protein
MSREKAVALVGHLSKMAQDGYTILTWNGLGFDFDVMAEESGAAGICGELALSHVDLMFHVVCCLGYPVGLDNAARGMGLPGKPAGMAGVKAPKLWAEGRYEEVLDYVAQDVRTTLQLGQHGEERHRLEWITRKARRARCRSRRDG